MKGSADIRKANKRAIYRFMLDGGAYTKQRVSRGTGLSIATCNTLLNDMRAQGIVSGGGKLAGEAGRSSVLYRIEDGHESYLAICFYIERGVKIAETVVFSATGRILRREKRGYARLDVQKVEEIIGSVVAQHGNFAQIIVGVPGIAGHGVIRHCDIPQLEGAALQETLAARFGSSVSVESDMHLKAYGYYKKEGKRDEVITLGYFPANVLPGTVTIHRGEIIRGANGFAGMTGFLPWGISREEQLALLRPEVCAPFIVRSICAIIVLLNPGTVVLTGELVDASILNTVKKACRADIPEEYMPEFRVVDSFDEYYLEGMFQLAVDRKEW